MRLILKLRAHCLLWLGLLSLDRSMRLYRRADRAYALAQSRVTGAGILAHRLGALSRR